MAKYLDNDGLSHLLAKLRLTFSKIGHTHSITPTTGSSATVTAGTAASLTTTNVSIPNISSKTVVTGVTKKTVVTGGTTTNVRVVADAGSTPTLGTDFTVPNISVTNKSIPNVTSAGTAATASVSAGVLTITNGTAPTLGTAISVGSASAGTAFTIPNVTSVGSLPTLLGLAVYTDLETGDSVDVSTGASITVGTATTAKAVDTFTPNTPTAVTPKTVVTGVSSTNASTN